MPLKLLHAHHFQTLLPIAKPPPTPYRLSSNHYTVPTPLKFKNGATMSKFQLKNRRPRSSTAAISASSAPLDLTEENITQVLDDARTELGQLFDASVNITGKAELAELDGPYVTIRLSGRFWHERSMVLARLGNYLKQRIPEILEVDIEDEKQLDDSPENF